MLVYSNAGIQVTRGTQCRNSVGADYDGKGGEYRYKRLMQYNVLVIVIYCMAGPWFGTEFERVEQGI